jgi:hypothetical protein
MSNETNKTISLTFPITVDGVEVKSLNLRRPKVKDQLAAQSGGSEMEREISLFANLTEQTPDTIKDLDLKDYQSLQEGFAGFLS